MSSPIPSYDLKEIQKHNSIKDAWVTCGGYVHNITSFMTSHPGGADYLLPVLGSDCEQAMEEHDHSSFSFALLKTFVIGTVKGQVQAQHNAPEPSHLRGYTVEQLDSAVDFNKATLPQIHALGDKYWPWLINRPVCKDNKLTIFPVKALEALSHYPWWYIWIVWTPVMLYNILAGFSACREVSSTLSAALATSAFSYVAGVLTWTATEYVLHRWVFHHEVSTPGGNVFHYFAHGIHHLIPTDSTRLTFPPVFAVVLAVLFFYGFRAAITSLFAASTLSHHLYFAGFMLGYVMYDTMHYFFHHTDFNNKIFRRLKAAHMNHHYKNEFANFGVSSPIWDFVMGTWDAETGNKKK